MKPKIKANLPSHLRFVENIKDLEPSVKCVVIGTIFKDMKLKPNILEEYTKEFHNQPSPEVSTIQKTVDEESSSFLSSSNDEKMMKMTSDEDFLVLEDDYGRMRLQVASNNPVTVTSLVTGIVAGCYGQVLDGIFEVEAFYFYWNVVSSTIELDNNFMINYDNLSSTLTKDVTCPTTSTLNSSNDRVDDSIISKSSNAQLTMEIGGEKEHAKDKYVAILSGFDIGSNQSYLYAQMVCNYLSGALGSSLEQSQLISRICRVIIAGNSIYPPKIVDSRTMDVRGSLKHTKLESIGKQLEVLDNLLVQLTSSVDVDVMPGRHDPCNMSFPQQPLHTCLLPKASSATKASDLAITNSPHSGGEQTPFSTGGNTKIHKTTSASRTLHLVTNPYCFNVDGVEFLGTSGQNVDDIRLYASHSVSGDNGGVVDEVDDVLKLMQDTVQWGLLCPTCPDTLDCYPLSGNSDPFIIKKLPNIYFVGNQPPQKSDFAVKILNVQIDGEDKDNNQRPSSENMTTLKTKQVKLVSIPSFKQRPGIVLINLGSLNVHFIDFKNII